MQLTSVYHKIQTLLLNLFCVCFHNPNENVQFLVLIKMNSCLPSSLRHKTFCWYSA